MFSLDLVRNLPDILLLVVAANFALGFLAMALFGIIRGKVGYEPKFREVHLKAQPVVFAIMVVFYLLLASAAGILAVLMFRHLVFPT